MKRTQAFFLIGGISVLVFFSFTLISFAQNLGQIKFSPQANPPVTCNSGNQGSLYVTTGGSFKFCDGTTWKSIIPSEGTETMTFGGTVYFPGSGVWNSSGNVGIGTTNPLSKLQIGASDGTDVMDTSARLRILSLNDQSQTPEVLLRLIRKHAGGLYYPGSVDFKVYSWGASGSPYYPRTALTFALKGDVQTHADSANIDVMTLRSDGFVGIGTTAPSVKLDIDGGAGQVVDVSGGRIQGLNTVPLATSEATSKYYVDSLFSTGRNTYTLSNGSGWYRIISMGGAGSGGMVRISGISGSNRYTDLTFYVSGMGYSQGSSINIVNNVYYNGNHVSNIRAGTLGSSFVVDVELNSIDNPTNITIDLEGGLSAMTPTFNPTAPTGGIVTVPGGVFGGGSSLYDTYLGVAARNVGIGTTNPGAKLSVHLNEANANTVPYINMFNDAGGYVDWSLKKNSYNDLTMYDAYQNIPLMTWKYVNGSGNVGIRTTDPSKTLEVAGDIALSSGGKIGQGRNYGTPGNSNDGTLELYNSASGNTTLWNSGYPIVFGANGAEVMRLVSGKVGIGKTNPDVKLDVLDTMKISPSDASHGTTRFNYGSFAGWENYLMSNLAGVWRSGLTLNHYYTGTGSYVFTGTNGKYKGTASILFTHNADIIFATNVDGTSVAPTTRMSIDNAGNVVFTGLVSGITPQNPANFTTKSYVDSAILSATSTMITNSLWSGTKNSTIWNGDAGVGNVGIGINSPNAKLDVRSSGENIIQWGDGTITGELGLWGSAAIFGTNTSHPLYFEVANGIVGTWTTGGNLGIGTASPDSTNYARLHVHNAASVPGRIKITGSGSGYTSADILFEAHAGIRGLGQYYFSPLLGSGAEWFSGIPYGSVDAFVINRKTTASFDSSVAQSDASGVSNFLYINSSGNVGIGTTSVGQKLVVGGTVQVNDNLNVGGPTDTTRYINLRYNGISWPNYASYFAQTGGNDVAGTRGLIINTNIGDALSNFGINFAVAGNSKMFIQHTGNVGIGTSNPSVKLDVDGGTGQVVDVSGGRIQGLNLVPTADSEAVPRKYLHDNFAPIAGGGYVLKTGDTMSGNLIFNNKGLGIVGTYDSTKYQAVFAMGDAYKLPADGSTTGTLYGLAWSHPNAGGVAANLNTHGLLVMENGTFLAALSGSIRARDDVRAPIHAVTSGSQFMASGQTQNMKLKGGAGTDVGLTAYNASDQWVWQLYGAGSQYGFLDSNWGGWDIQKTRGGDMVLNNSQTVLHTGNIGSQSVNYAASAGNADTVDSQHFALNSTPTLSGLIPYGVSGDSGMTGARSYQFGYQSPGPWTHPYPDLVLGYHTGVQIGGNSSYGGVRFYNDHPSLSSTEIMSVGNGDNHVRVANNLYVGGTISWTRGTTGYTYADSGGSGITNASPYTGGALLYLAGNSFYFYNGSINNVIINASGNVGIKKAPSTELDVNGTVTATQFVGGGAGITGVTATNATNATYVLSPDGDRNAGAKLPTTNPRAVRFDFANANTAGTGGNYAGVMTYAPWDGTTGSTGDASYQLAFGSTAANGGGIPQLNIRKGIDSTWNSWYTIIHSGNIASQSVNYANIAGSAAANGGNSDTVDSQHFSYTNNSNAPTYLWGTDSNGSSYLASRASMSVSYAATAGSATDSTRLLRSGDTTTGLLNIGAGVGFNTDTNDSWFPYTNGVNYFRGPTQAFTTTWYDETSNSYYIDPSSTSNFNTVSAASYCINGANCISAWPSGGGGYWTLNGSIISTQYNLNVASGVGKIDAGTIDPPYTIDGKKYATYMASMTGVKEETTGIIQLLPISNYQHVIDFKNVEVGSDLWLFAKTTNLKKNFGQMTILLSAGFDGKVWYEKNEKDMTLTISGSKGGEVSYRLTAPRFDTEKWGNMRTEGSEGFNLDTLLKK